MPAKVKSVDFFDTDTYVVEAEVHIPGTQTTVTSPAQFILAATMNPLPLRALYRTEAAMLLHAQADRELPPAHQRPLLDRIDRLWARAYNRIVKVVSTIADLGGSERCLAPQLGEAIYYGSSSAAWSRQRSGNRP